MFFLERIGESSIRPISSLSRLLVALHSRHSDQIDLPEGPVSTELLNVFNC
jgi:hypothetical protein